MTELVSIEYQLGRAGWSSFRLNVGTDSVVIGPFGFCTDALGDLVRAALVIATSGLYAEVSFDAEPMEWRLVVGPNPAVRGSSDFSVRVYTFEDASGRPVTGGSKSFEAQCSPDSFVLAVLNAAQDVWNDHGNDGYDRLWGGPSGFPIRALTALKAAITVEDTRTNWKPKFPPTST